MTNTMPTHVIFQNLEGLYRKYEVRRLGGTPGKHDDCEFFVLDWNHDPFAIPAARAYADACQTEYPELAEDLRLMVDIWERRRADMPKDN